MPTSVLRAASLWMARLRWAMSPSGASICFVLPRSRKRTRGARHTRTRYRAPVSPTIKCTILALHVAYSACVCGFSTAKHGGEAASPHTHAVARDSADLLRA
jgi:hypothetical protein